MRCFLGHSQNGEPLPRLVRAVKVVFGFAWPRQSEVAVELPKCMLGIGAHRFMLHHKPIRVTITRQLESESV